MRLGVRVVVMRLVQRLPGKASDVQKRIDGLKFLWRPNIEGDRGGSEWPTGLRSAGMWLINKNVGWGE